MEPTASTPGMVEYMYVYDRRLEFQVGGRSFTIYNHEDVVQMMKGKGKLPNPNLISQSRYTDMCAIVGSSFRNPRVKVEVFHIGDNVTNIIAHNS